jgi:phosphoribosylaminoimidazolecarboxamide formyltransferase/IMP cyclohydrolase
MFKNALISVSDKNGLIEFIKPFVGKGLRVVSTGGTAEYLRSHQIPVVDVSEQTHFPEVMGGRVKTLHPHIHMPLLARKDHPEDLALLAEHGLQAFDLVICNLYPFAEALKSGQCGAELIEKIDIGGPTLLRAAAKNFNRVTVVCDPLDYPKISASAEMTLSHRQRLAAKVFSHVSSYDSLIAETLAEGSAETAMQTLLLSGEKVFDLRYGENPQQKASWYRSQAQGLHQAEILQGKELSYNNLLDLEAATDLVRQFSKAAAVVVKHNNPCGVAENESLSLAVEQAITADPISAFGGIVACNQTLDATSAETLSRLFLECIIAPAISSEAKEILAKKKNLRVLVWPGLLTTPSAKSVRTVSGGFLIQETDVLRSVPSKWVIHGEKPSPEILHDLQFGEKVCAALKSNAIALVKWGQTKGLGMGQVNRVDAVTQAIARMKQQFGDLQNSILVSDAFFPFPDSVEKAAAAGVKWILQPGGSIKDDEVVAIAKTLKVNMILTGERHFRH